MNQLEIHKRIDNFFQAGIKSASSDVALELVGYNEDAKRYFFTKADKLWLKWIWDKNLFKDLSKKIEDPTKYSYRLPELEYLRRMAEDQEFQLVTEIIDSIKISKDTFNPEVIDRFIWILGLLPAKQIEILLPKIIDENWPSLMASYGRSGYEYQVIIEKLKKEEAYNALIEFSKIILATRTKEELKTVEKFFVSDKLFYTHDVSATGIFEILTNLKNIEEKEKALKILLEILSNVVRLGNDPEEKVFSTAEPFYLADVDIFTDDLNTDRRSYSKDDIENLVIASRELIKDLFNSACNDIEGVRRLYTTYILPLPDSRTMYRLTLFAITRCPKNFKEEIKESLFRVFKVGERYFDIEGGAEYHHALIASFGVLDEKTTQREYVSKVFEYFAENLNDEDKEKWRKRDGLEILTYIKKYLTDPETKKSERLFGQFTDNEELKPHPSIGKIRTGAGVISPKSPVNLADFTVKEILEHLKTDWSPKALQEKFKDEDHENFFTPRGSEGLGDALKEDFKDRIPEYFESFNEFFNREFIDPSYLYSLLREIDEMLRNKKVFTNEIYILMINLFNSIRLSGEKKEFEKSSEKSWLADWITVHKIIADILLNVLDQLKDSSTFKENRVNILAIIKYLLSIKSSPDPEDDKRESAELAHVAINSVRGQAFRALVQLTYNDGNKSLEKDVQVLYKEVIDNDTSNAVRFTIGQFLASFYFRDIPFVRSLLPKIFPINEVGKEKLYFATWEGYLAASLYKELFIELQKYYEHAIKVKTEDYPDRKYLKGLDETLATHLALAYAHFDFKIGDPLFDLFWKTPNEKRHYEFVSFIGRNCLTREQAGDKWFEENGVKKEKLVEFWNWMLTTDTPIEPKAFSGFGFWINSKKEIIEDKIVVEKMAVTLKKSNGEIDWEYGLLDHINKFAEIDPKNTLEIIKNLFLLNTNLSPQHRMYFNASDQIKEPLRIIYMQGSLQKEVEKLIDGLITKYSSIFWGLKDILIK